MHRVEQGVLLQNSAFTGHSSILRELQAATPSRRDCIHCLFQRGGAVERALVLTLKTPCLCPFWHILHLSLAWYGLEVSVFSDLQHHQLDTSSIYSHRILSPEKGKSPGVKGSNVHRGRA